MITHCCGPRSAVSTAMTARSCFSAASRNSPSTKSPAYSNAPSAPPRCALTAHCANFVTCISSSKSRTCPNPLSILPLLLAPSSLPPMNCSTAQERFSDLLDGRLPEVSTAEVRAHLASCPDCQREYAALAQTLVALDALPAAKPGPALRKNFYAMLEEEKNSAA